MEIALAHISEPPPPPRMINANIPEAVEYELLKALDKNPEKRHKTATELVDAIRRSYEATGKRPNVVSTPPAPPQKADPVPAQTKRVSPTPMMVLVGIALLIALAFIINGLTGFSIGSSSGPEGAAPVTLIYDDSSFTIINEGSYTLEVQGLNFVRGVPDDGDDFSGDRIPRDILPPATKCFQILISGGSSTVPPQCRPINENRQGQEMLSNAQRVHWRSEAEGNTRISSFEVWLGSQFLTRCDTVARGEHKECRFIWPVVPELPDE
jgi:hypothetical protein